MGDVLIPLEGLLDANAPIRDAVTRSPAGQRKGDVMRAIVGLRVMCVMQIVFYSHIALWWHDTPGCADTA